MGKIIACIDGEKHASSVCCLSSWVAKNTHAEVAILHVAEPHSDVAAKVDCSGAIGLGAKNGLLKELTALDEAHGKEEQRKGHAMLQQAMEALASADICNVETVHRRGALIETLLELEDNAELIVMGKLASKIGTVLKNIHKPLLIATKDIKPIRKFLLAYDGSASSKQALEYVISSPLLKGVECHLVKVCEKSGKAEAILKEANEALTEAGFAVNASLPTGQPVHKVLFDYTEQHDIDLLVIGAYGHSKIRSLILGEATSELIHKSNIPVLLFKG